MPSGRAATRASPHRHGRVALGGTDPGAALAVTRLDNTRRGEDVPFVLVAAPGDVRHCQRVATAPGSLRSVPG
jgi:hypothetical protein